MYIIKSTHLLGSVDFFIKICYHIITLMYMLNNKYCAYIIMRNYFGINYSFGGGGRLNDIS